MSFRVSSMVDSRTVLDANGAERLLGMGDGLFMPPGSSDLMRFHGAFVTEEETEQVVRHIKAQRGPQYVELTLPDDGESGAGEDADLDPMYDQAVAVVAAAGKASTSLLQRRLKLGYNRAARIIDSMEQQGVIGPADGSRPREVFAPSYDG
jgi:S-DNA-T family DNA segregation ATPase FtsK/SpoIIIE